LYRPLCTFQLWPPDAPAPIDAFRTLAAEVGTYGREQGPTILPKCRLIPFSKDIASFQTACLSSVFSDNSSDFIQILWWFSHSRSVELLLLTNTFHWGIFFSLTGLPSPLVTSTQTFRQPCKVVPLYTMNAYTDSRGTSPPILNLSTSWRWAVWRKQQTHKEAWRKLWNVDENTQLPTAFTSVQEQCLHLHGRASLYSSKTSINHLPDYTMQPRSPRPQHQPCPKKTVIGSYSQINRIHKLISVQNSF
jgi:hypothetical protein